MESPTGKEQAGVEAVVVLLTCSSFHLLPSGLMNPRCMNFIGSGVVFHMCVITKSSDYDPIDRQTGILLMSRLARTP